VIAAHPDVAAALHAELMAFLRQTGSPAAERIAGSLAADAAEPAAIRVVEELTRGSEETANARGAR